MFRDTLCIRASEFIAGYFFVAGEGMGAELCRVVGSNPGLCPLDVSSTPYPVVTTKNISRDGQMSPGVAKSRLVEKHLSKKE